MIVTAPQYGTFFNTPRELPADVRALIFSHLTLEEFQRIAATHRASFHDFKRFSHQCVKFDFSKFFNFLNLNISPLITEHPFTLERIEGLNTCRNSSATRDFISQWLAEVFEWSKKTENTNEAARFASFFHSHRRENPKTFVKEMLCLNTPLRAIDFYDLLYCVFAKFYIFSSFESVSGIQDFDYEPLLADSILSRCKSDVKEFRSNNITRRQRGSIARFIDRFPFAEYIREGLITADDVSSDYVKLELRRLLIGKVDFVVDNSCYTLISDKSKSHVIQATFINYQKTKEPCLLEWLDYYQKDNPILYAQKVKKLVESTRTEVFHNVVHGIINVLKVASIAAACFCAIRACYSKENRVFDSIMAVLLTVITLMEHRLTLFFREWDVSLERDKRLCIDK